MRVGWDFPDLVARTGRFRHGAPYDVTVAADGARVAFLRSAGPDDPDAALWVLNVAGGTETCVSPAGGTGFGVARPARTAAFALDRRLYRADLVAGTYAEVPTA